jgi:protein gp37
MKRFPQKPIHLNEEELKINLGEDKFIFIGSSTDMFAEDVPKEWISKVLAKCKKYEGNSYLFQTKNPGRFWKFQNEFPNKSVFGTTLETNRNMLDISKAMTAFARVSWMTEPFMIRRMVTIEPILDFDLEPLVEMIKRIAPEWVNIGADSKGHNLPEPSKEKIEALITELRKFTEVKIKDNLKRLIN